MKNERFERYIYTGVTAILVLIAAVFSGILSLLQARTNDGKSFAINERFIPFSWSQKKILPYSAPVMQRRM